MRAVSAEAIALLEAGTAMSRTAIWFSVGSGYGVWDDAYGLTFSGRTFSGQARRFTISPIMSVSDGSINGEEIVFSGVDPSVYAFVQNEIWHRKLCEIYRLIFNPFTMVLVDSLVWHVGELDAADIEDAPNGLAKLTIRSESISRDIERKGGLNRTEASQRRIQETDGFFKHVSVMRSSPIWWGKTPPKVPGGRGPDGDKWGSVT